MVYNIFVTLMAMGIFLKLAVEVKKLLRYVLVEME